MTKQQTIELLKTQLPGFYSMEQVIDLINKIEEGPATSTMTEEQILNLTEKVLGALENRIDNLDSDDYVEVDKNSATFDIENGNEIVFDEVCFNFDTSSLYHDLRDVVEEALNEYFDL